MTEAELYTSLVSDSFLSSLLVPLHKELIFFVIAAFQLPGVVMFGVAATLLSAMGFAINWGAGKLLHDHREKIGFAVADSKMQRVFAVTNRYGKFLLLFCWFDVVGGVLTVAAGFLQVRLLPFLLLVITGKALYYWASVRMMLL